MVSVLTEQAGCLWQAEDDVYYIVGQDIYDVDENALKLVLSIPMTAEIIGNSNGTLYWINREIEAEGNGAQAEEKSVCRIYAQNTKKETEESELIYETNLNIAMGSVLTGGKLCTANSSGVYVIDISTGVMNCIFEQETDG